MRLKPVPAEQGATARTLTFDSNQLCAVLFGQHHEHLALIEQRLPVSLAARGNLVTISGEPALVDAAGTVLEELYRQLEGGLEIGRNEVDAAVRMVLRAPGDALAIRGDDVVIQTERRRVSPRTPTQATYLRAMRRHDLVFGIGPAGTGKTYLAVAIVCRASRSRSGRDRMLRPAPCASDCSLPTGCRG
jgi:phosphate starvation-inducible PhoH-like protein